MEIGGSGVGESVLLFALHTFLIFENSNHGTVLVLFKKIETRPKNVWGNLNFLQLEDTLLGQWLPSLPHLSFYGWRIWVQSKWNDLLFIHYILPQKFCAAYNKIDRHNRTIRKEQQLCKGGENVVEIKKKLKGSYKNWA